MSEVSRSHDLFHFGVTTTFAIFLDRHSKRWTYNGTGSELAYKTSFQPLAVNAALLFHKEMTRDGHRWRYTNALKMPVYLKRCV